MTKFVSTIAGFLKKLGHWIRNFAERISGQRDAPAIIQKLGRWLGTSAEWIAGKKDAFAAIQSIATVFAIIVGGWWTYSTFIQHRQDVPWASVENSVTFRNITPDHKWLRVEAKIKNTGRVSLDISDITARILRIRPVSDDLALKLYTNQPATKPNWGIAEWPNIGEQNLVRSVSIEPSESETYRFDFFVSQDVETVYVYTFVKHDRDTEERGETIGWSATTVLDVSSESNLDLS